jgi:hypothetical protein
MRADHRLFRSPGFIRAQKFTSGFAPILHQYARDEGVAWERELRKNYISIVSDRFEEQRALAPMTRSGDIVKDRILGLLTAVLNRFQRRAMIATGDQPPSPTSRS